MPRNRENVYTCRKCGRQLVTRDRDEGVTPFMMRCDPDRTPDGCGAEMFSAGYGSGRALPPHAPPTHEWYKPTPAELDAECDAVPGGTASWLRDHVRRGGLLIRRLTPSPADAQKQEA